MKKFLKFALILLIAGTAAACSKVPAGNVGVKVYLLGGAKGVDAEELPVGLYWIGWNEELYLFPTFTQNYVWTKDRNEVSENDESITFQTVEGLSVSADIGISYHIDPTKVSEIFQRYRKRLDEITDIYLRNMVRDALVTQASTLKVESVYGQGKAVLMDNVEKYVRDQVQELGIVVERIYWIGTLRLPNSVIAAIDAKIGATQKAQQRQNEVAQARAEADKKVEEARGAAESIKLKAVAEADAVRIKGAALRENPVVLQLSAIEKWDGVLPRITGGGAVPFINADAMSAAKK